MNAVGSHIKKLRKQQDLSQEALAKQLNITRQAVSQWENGNTQPDIDTLERIAKAFGVDILEVIYGEKRKTAPRLTPQERKRYWIRFAGFGILTLALWVLLNQLRQTDLFDPKYEAWVYIYQYIGPIFYLLIPISVLSGCSLVWDIRIQHWITRLIILLTTLSIIIFYYILTLIFEFSTDGIIISDFLWYSYMYIIVNHALFVLPGIGLFLGLNGRRTEIKKTERA